MMQLREKVTQESREQASLAWLDLLQEVEGSSGEDPRGHNAQVLAAHHTRGIAKPGPRTSGRVVGISDTGALPAVQLFRGCRVERLLSRLPSGGPVA